MQDHFYSGDTTTPKLYSAPAIRSTLGNECLPGAATTMHVGMSSYQNNLMYTLEQEVRKTAVW